MNISSIVLFLHIRTWMIFFFVNFNVNATAMMMSTSRIKARLPPACRTAWKYTITSLVSIVSITKLLSYHFHWILLHKNSNILMFYEKLWAVCYSHFFIIHFTTIFSSFIFIYELYIMLKSMLTLGKLSRRQTDDIFRIFPGKYALTFHANCLLRRQFAWSVKAYFLEKLRKIFQNITCWNFYHKWLSVKVTNGLWLSFRKNADRKWWIISWECFFLFCFFWHNISKCCLLQLWLAL